MSADFIVEFYFKAFGIELPETLHMRAPRGETVIDPHRGRGHVGEMARRFPDARYAYHPELSRSNLGSPMAGIYSNAPALAGAAALAIPAYLMATSTAVYPTVAGPQYQSAASGQPGIGSSALSIEPASTWEEFFSWSYWSS